MIHVCFGIHDKTGRYSKFTGTAILSVLENLRTPPRSACIHILHDNTLTQDNREKFSYVAGQYNQVVKFYNVEELCADKLAEMTAILPSVINSRVTIGAFYRLLLPQILPTDIDRVIYLDSDIIVNLDIKELWQIDLGNQPLAAITEISNGVDSKTNFILCAKNIVKAEDYFNSGVLLMNLKKFRKEWENIFRSIKFVGEIKDFFDQNILNHCFSTRYLKLPNKFNRFAWNVRRRNESVEKKIYHFTVGSIELNMNDPLNRLWTSYFIKTPWFDEEAIGRLYFGFRQVHTSLKNMMKRSVIRISAIMSGKTRAFFVLPQNLEAIKNFFLISDDEEIILAENRESSDKLIDAMKKSQGKKVFFIVLPNFPFKILIDAGFAHGRDFLNGFEFLADTKVLMLDSHALVKTM